MKRTTKQPTTDRRANRTLTNTDLAQVTGGDIYMHDPKGSNNSPGGGG
jgi:bacteriocin-like protein